jgi:transcriptional regulator with XRE-family HTH domain
MKIGEKIAMVRKLRGLKQEALAIMIGTSQSCISAIEKRKHIKGETLRDIAKILEVTPDYIKNFDPDAVLEMINKEQAPIQVEISIEDVINQKYIVSKEDLKELPFDPLEKIIELYKRLLLCEQEKIRILRAFKN